LLHSVTLEKHNNKSFLFLSSRRRLPQSSSMHPPLKQQACTVLQEEAELQKQHTPLCFSSWQEIDLSRLLGKQTIRVIGNPFFTEFNKKVFQSQSYERLASKSSESRTFPE
jgi:hypothetical protein